MFTLSSLRCFKLLKLHKNLTKRKGTYADEIVEKYANRLLKSIFRFFFFIKRNASHTLRRLALHLVF